MALPRHDDREGRPPLTSIHTLPARIDALAEAARGRAARLLEVQAIESHADPPATLEPWIERTFGSVEAVRTQRLARVTNLATLESTVFASLRARRPIDGDGAAEDLQAEIEAAVGGPFCHPEQDTPADTFGRIRGRRMLSGANAAQAEAHHGVLVFDEHDPLSFDADLVADLFETGRAWADRARATDPAAVHYLLIWNCLWRAGGSIIHGHAQVLLGRGRPHARLDRFRHDAATYLAGTGRDLVDDLVGLHGDLGLSRDAGDGITVLAHVTPTKEGEVIVVGPSGMDEREPAFAAAVGDTLVALRDRRGVRSFNLALWRDPLDVPDPTRPPMVRIVDRGNPLVRPSDIGAMELYGSPIVGTDPYDLVAALDPTG